MVNPALMTMEDLRAQVDTGELAVRVAMWVPPALGASGHDAGAMRRGAGNGRRDTGGRIWGRLRRWS